MWDKHNVMGSVNSASDKMFGCGYVCGVVLDEVIDVEDLPNTGDNIPWIWVLNCISMEKVA